VAQFPVAGALELPFGVAIVADIDADIERI
jgi:hypothetical protein